MLEALSALCARVWPRSKGVVDLRRLSAGATQEIWRFDLLQDGGPQPLIMRRLPGEWRVGGVAIALESEAALIMAAGAAGVPTARVRHVLEPGDGLGRGFVMDLVSGETLGGRIVRSEALAGARVGLARRCGEVLARIHATPPDGLPALPVLAPSDLLAQWSDAYHASGRARPVFALALRWLRERTPAPSASRLVHGDFRNGNLMVGPEGLRAVLDWELAHLGDPAEDLGWICVPSWRFGRSDYPVGGFGMREDLYAGYAAGGGVVDIGAMRWWEMFGVLRWGVMCAGMPATFRSGDGSVERAVIAHRASEAEIDLLAMLDA